MTAWSTLYILLFSGFPCQQETCRAANQAERNVVVLCAEHNMAARRSLIINIREALLTLPVCL